MLWQQCLNNLREKLADQSFQEYIADLKLTEVSEFRAIVEVPHNKDLRKISRSFKGLIELAYSEVANQSLDFEFRHPENQNARGAMAQHSPFTQSPRNMLQEEFTFDSFVVGGKSQFAYSAAVAVAESPGSTQFNPLLIYGGSGLGKTHLLQAIGNFIVDEDPSTRVHYVTAEDFTREFVDSIKSNRIAEFSTYYRTKVDLLMIDDIQFLDRKVETQNEFFHIFNTLHQAGKQIVLTSDNQPSEVKGLEDRLISRFQWGLCVDVQPPDVETREAILRKKADKNHLDIDDEIIGFLATNIEGNVRLLEGAISKLILLSTVERTDITIGLARQVVEEIQPAIKKQVNKDDILSIVADFYSVEEDKLLEAGRGTKEVAHARQLAMYLMKELTNLSLKSVGKRFADRDHSTVVHAIKLIQRQMEEDATFKRTVDGLKNKLNDH